MRVAFFSVLCSVLYCCLSCTEHVEPETQAQFLCQRGQKLESSGRASEAVTYYDSALGLAPNCAKAYRLRAGVHRRSKDLARALADYKQAIVNGDSTASVHFELAQTLIQLSKYTDAVSELSKAISLGLDSPQSRLLRGRLYLEQGDIDSAVFELKYVIGNDSGNIDALNLLGDASLKKGDTSAAIDYYGRSFKLAPQGNAALPILRHLEGSHK